MLGVMKAIKPWKPEQNEKYELAKVGSVGVKLYRRARQTLLGETRWIFEVVDNSQGKRRLRSFSDLAKARGEARRIAEQVASGKTTAAAMTNPEAAAFGRAAELLRPTGISLELAAATVAKAFEILGGDRLIEAATFLQEHGAGKITPRTIGEVVEELWQAKEARGKSARYIGDLRARLRKFAKAHPQRGISNVTTADVQAYLDSLKSVACTVRTIRARLFALFAFAEARGYIRKRCNPVLDTERISANNDGEIAIYAPAEIAALLAGAPENFVPVLALGAFAGLRTAEIQRLQWTDVDLAGAFIHVGAEMAKTRTRRLVPIVPNLAQWLAPYAKQRGAVWKGTENHLGEARTATVAKSGVAWKHNALRHSFCSYRLAAVQSAAQVALEAGNSPAMVFRHYRELVKPTDATAWFAIAPEAPANVLTLKTEVAV